MYIDAQDLRKFSAEINANLKTTPRKVRASVKKGAVNIKKQLVREAGQSRHFGQVAKTINFDMRATGGVDSLTVEAEIGPDKHWRSARIANIAYFGSSRAGGGTLPEPAGALGIEVPKLEKYLLQIGEEIIP